MSRPFDKLRERKLRDVPDLDQEYEALPTELVGCRVSSVSELRRNRHQQGRPDLLTHEGCGEPLHEAVRREGDRLLAVTLVEHLLRLPAGALVVERHLVLSLDDRAVTLFNDIEQQLGRGIALG